MPRIKAASVAEHVAEQEAAVLSTAVRLFCERGYEHVTIGDIATEIGLKRNSLYRYFPDKAHILVRWFQQELPQQVARSEQILRGDGSPRERIEAWALDQADYANSSEHELMARISTIIPELDDATRRELADSHDALTRPMLDTLDEAGITAVVDQQVVAAMIQQLSLATARVGSSATGRRYLRRAIGGLLIPVEDAAG